MAGQSFCNCICDYFITPQDFLPSSFIPAFDKSATIQNAWKRRAQANINDSHNEYLSDLSRIASTSYIPTERDILISRVRTTQVTVERYIIEGVQFEIYDVGGQRSERRKWVNCFENVDAVIFVAALSEYDQTLAEAKRQNRMVEALNLFESVVKNAHFTDTCVMLFLNKKDIFAEKIMTSNIADSPFFSDYAGPTKDFDHGVLYFIQKFESYLEEDEFNDSFIHVTCATDTNNMEFVLDSTMNIIMTEVSFFHHMNIIFLYIQSISSQLSLSKEPSKSRFSWSGLVHKICIIFCCNLYVHFIMLLVCLSTAKIIHFIIVSFVFF
jgi:GTPase SAR1 family protein